MLLRANEMKRYVLSLILGTVFCVSCYSLPHVPQANAVIEKVRKLKTSKKKPEKEPQFGFLEASDKTVLSYAYYRPQEPQAILLFYHGSGANGCAGYPYMAEQLSTTYNIATYLFDMRGHGKSGGERGTTPSSEQIWSDVRGAMEYIKTIHPGVPVFLGAHSGGGGMLINYAHWQQHSEPAGYLLITPMLGKQANVVREREQKSTRPFARINIWSLLVYQLSGGWIGGDWNAVTFNYPDHLIEERGFVPSYTVNMVHALNPSNLIKTLSNMRVPMHIVIADEDEFFDPIKMDNILDPIRHTNKHINVVHVKDAFHLTILGEVHDHIGRAIQDML